MIAHIKILTVESFTSHFLMSFYSQSNTTTMNSEIYKTALGLEEWRIIESMGGWVVPFWVLSWCTKTYLRWVKIHQVLERITQRTASSFVIVSQEENNPTMIVNRVQKKGHGSGGPSWS